MLNNHQENEIKHTSKDGVVFIQKTSKIHISSLLNKIQSVANLSRADADADADEGAGQQRQNGDQFRRQASVDSSHSSSKISFTDDADQKSKRQSSKKRHAPTPPDSLSASLNGGFSLTLTLTSTAALPRKASIASLNYYLRSKILLLIKRVQVKDNATDLFSGPITMLG